MCKCLRKGRAIGRRSTKCEQAWLEGTLMLIKCEWCPLAIDCLQPVGNLMETLLQDKPTYQLSYRKSFCLSIFFIFSLHIRTCKKGGHLDQMFTAECVWNYWRLNFTRCRKSSWIVQSKLASPLIDWFLVTEGLISYSLNFHSGLSSKIHCSRLYIAWKVRFMITRWTHSRNVTLLSSGQTLVPVAYTTETMSLDLSTDRITLSRIRP